MAEIGQYLQQSLEITRSLLELARKGEWDAVFEQQKKRLGFLESWEAHEKGTIPQDVEEAVLQEMLTLNDEIVELSSGARDSAQKELLGMRKSKVATSAYKKCP